MSPRACGIINTLCCYILFESRVFLQHFLDPTYPALPSVGAHTHIFCAFLASADFSAHLLSFSLFPQKESFLTFQIYPSTFFTNLCTHIHCSALEISGKCTHTLSDPHALQASTLACFLTYAAIHRPTATSLFSSSTCIDMSTSQLWSL